MADNNTVCNYLCDLPTEIFFNIFGLLSVKDLSQCRLVSRNWKLIVDSLFSREQTWREFCRTDYRNVYVTARLKANVSLTWHNLYRSLSLWPKILSAKEIVDEFAHASVAADELMNFNILENGEIGVHIQSSILYYNLDNLEPSTRGKIRGYYARYTETPKCLAILGFNRSLYVARKVLYNQKYEDFVTFRNVKYYIHYDKEIYFLTLYDEICFCNVTNDGIETKFLPRFPEAIMCMSFQDNLYILTLEKNIYSYINGRYSLECTLGSDLVKVLIHYNFLDKLDWTVFYEWWYSFKGDIQENFLRDVSVAKQYGDMIFIGTRSGVLRLYYFPETSQHDLFETSPIKQWNFMERIDCPVLSLSTILKIDIVEKEQGHKIVVATPKKIIVLQLSH